MLIENGHLEKECNRYKIRLGRRTPGGHSIHGALDNDTYKMASRDKNLSSIQVMDTLDEDGHKRLLMEIKNLKHETSVLRGHVQERDDIISEQLHELENITLKCKEQERQIASFSIWRKSYMYEGNKSLIAQKKLRNLLSVPPSILERKQTNVSTMFIKIQLQPELQRQIEDLWEQLKDKVTPLPDSSAQQQSSDPTQIISHKVMLKPFDCHLNLVTFDDQDADKPEICFSSTLPEHQGTVKHPEYHFDLRRLEHGREYKMASFVKDNNHQVIGKKAIFSFISDLLPPVPQVAFTYELKENSIKVRIERNWKTVSKIIIYHLPTEQSDPKKDEDWQIYDTVDLGLAKETITKQYKSEIDGTHIFRVSQMNQIGESKFTDTIAIDMIQPCEPVLESCSFDKQNNLVVSWHLSDPIKTKYIHVEFPGNREEKCKFASAKLVKQVIKAVNVGKTVFKVRVFSESPGGQVSNPKLITIDPSITPPYPKTPLYNVKSQTSLIMYPNIEMSSMAKLTAIQARYRQSQQKEFKTTDIQNTTVGLHLTDLPPTDLIQVGIRYCVGNSWSMWSEWETVIMAAALELPPSLINLSRKSTTPAATLMSRFKQQNPKEQKSSAFSSKRNSETIRKPLQSSLKLAAAATKSASKPAIVKKKTSTSKTFIAASSSKKK